MDRGRSRSPARGGLEVTWYKYMSPEGHSYYHSPQTGQTTWEYPSGPGDRVLDPAAMQPAVQQGFAEMTVWQRCCDSTGRQYYHNPKTQQTVWERPCGPNDRVEDHPALVQTQQMTAMSGMFGVPNAMAGMTTMQGSAVDVESFIALNKIDDSAANRLRSCPDHIRRAIIDRGNLQDARNPNAVLMGRIRDAENSGGGGGGGFGGSLGGGLPRAGPPPGSAPSTDVNVFIKENGIDTTAGEKLRSLPADLQKGVMERGNLTDARNPNAMLMGRIRDALAGR